MENIKELRSLRAEQVEVAEKAITEEKPEEAKTALEQIKELDARIEKVEQEVKDLKDKEDKQENEDKEKENKTNDEPKAQEGEQRNMTNNFKPEINENKVSAEVRGFMDFLTSKGEVRENVTTVNSEAVIPQDIVTTPVQLPETVTNLKDYVNVIKVQNGQGSYPILESATERMISVAELAKNPELASPKFLDVDYKVETYRGQIAVSEEALQDSTPDLANLVAENNARIGLNTTNAEIAEVMKSFPAKNVDGTDGIKDILNVDLDPAYNVTAVMSQSFFNAIDKLKDAQGQYILQNDITSPSGKSLFGRKVEVISDALLGKAGEANAFIGDVKQAVLFADRAQASVKWVQNDIYGQLLAISQRFDVVKANEKAGFMVKLAVSPSTEA